MMQFLANHTPLIGLLLSTVCSVAFGAIAMRLVMQRDVDKWRKDSMGWQGAHISAHHQITNLRTELSRVNRELAVWKPVRGAKGKFVRKQ